MSKKNAARTGPPVSPSVNSTETLAVRVSALEQGFSKMQQDLTSMGEDLAALRNSSHHVEERSQRGELLMLEIQGVQRKMARVLDAIAGHLQLEVPTTTVSTAAEIPLEPEMPDEEP